MVPIWAVSIVYTNVLNLNENMYTLYSMYVVGEF